MVDKQQLAAMGEHMREMEGCKPEFKVPDWWRLVPLKATPEMWIAAENLAAEEYSLGVYADDVSDMYASMLSAAPEYKP